MNIIRSTRTTSMNGIMLISDSDDCVLPVSCGITYCLGRRLGGGNSIVIAEGLFDLGGDLKRERVQALCEISNIAQETIIKNNSRNGCKKSRRGGDQRLRDARCAGTQPRRARCAKPGERVDDAPDRTEEPDERRDRACGGQP